MMQKRRLILPGLAALSVSAFGGAHAQGIGLLPGGVHPGMTLDDADAALKTAGYEKTESGYTVQSYQPAGSQYDDDRNGTRPTTRVGGVDWVQFHRDIANKSDVGHVTWRRSMEGSCFSEIEARLGAPDYCASPHDPATGEFRCEWTRPSPQYRMTGRYRPHNKECEFAVSSSG